VLTGKYKRDYQSASQSSFLARYAMWVGAYLVVDLLPHAYLVISKFVAMNCLR